MRTSKVSGIIFANSHDETLKGLTDIRSMASVPFGGRYRLVDFALSNFVNAGISNIGIITKKNYRSLMDHIGSGIYWDLDRKSGGIHIMPPFNVSGSRRYHGYIEALYGSLAFLERATSKYIVLLDSGIVANINLSAALDFHIENGADITVVCHKKQGENLIGAMTAKCDKEGKISAVDFPKTLPGETAVSMGIYIFDREKLLNSVKSAYAQNAYSLEKDIIAENLDKFSVYGFMHEGTAFIMDGTATYKAASMALLNAETRKDLFNKDRPIYTKTRDDMPTRFGTKANVQNCFIADGCVIEGTVKNSVLFRGVKIGKDAVVENCILMQGVTVGNGAKLNYAVSDKNGFIGDNMTVMGTKEKSFFVEKNQSL